MKFSADKSVEFYIRKKTRESRLGFFGCLFIFLFISCAFYYNVSNLILAEINIGVVGIFTLLLIKSVVGKEASNINSIVKSLDISDKISLCTYSYDFLFYRINAINKEIEKSDLILENINFPFNEQGLKNNETLRIKLNDQSFYILYKSFPIELEKELKKMDIDSKLS